MNILLICTVLFFMLPAFFYRHESVQAELSIRFDFIIFILFSDKFQESRQPPSKCAGRLLLQFMSRIIESN